jgi:hypothetical protein
MADEGALGISRADVTVLIVGKSWQLSESGLAPV